MKLLGQLLCNKSIIDGENLNPSSKLVIPNINPNDNFINYSQLIII